ncbi:MAG: hypothetical protein KA716_04285 [Gloeotrichia echinulata DEX184]|nr:hypothetical protein [Gloeotrichia echinulata DEX184]
MTAYHDLFVQCVSPKLVEEGILTESDEQELKKEPKPSIDHDWRDPSKPRNPEDDVIVDGWRGRADGTFEKIEDTEKEQ